MTKIECLYWVRRTECELEGFEIDVLARAIIEEEGRGQGQHSNGHEQIQTAIEIAPLLP